MNQETCTYQSPIKDVTFLRGAIKDFVTKYNEEELKKHQNLINREYYRSSQKLWTRKPKMLGKKFV